MSLDRWRPQVIAAALSVGLLSPGFLAASDHSAGVPSAEAPDAGSVFKDCAFCPDMVVIPPGAFIMGSKRGEPRRGSDEGPRRRVSIARPFAVSVFEITLDQFAVFAASRPDWAGGPCRVWQGSDWVSKWVVTDDASWRNPGYETTGQSPVVCVSWSDAQEYVRWLSGVSGQTYRLLSEAEWEYVARATSTERYSFGNEFGLICEHGNTAENQMDTPWTTRGCDDGYGARSSPVGTYASNAFGLYDVHGNVWEWVEDCWVDSYRGAPDDGAARRDDDCERRVSRGGSWDSARISARSANRRWNPSDYRISNTGFRVARDLGEP